jgi:GTP pyrophosphokinase/guanosine-3',5'-bis(diphosphate) 3'-pyrophosphohydrolase
VDTLLEQVTLIKTPEQATYLLGSYYALDQKIINAVNFAKSAHEGQFRKSGEPYVIHPIIVASIVASLGGDESMILAAILHDVVEDTPRSLENVLDLFGKDVADLVDGLTKIDKIREENLLPSSQTDEKLIKSAMTFQKILLASINDIRVLVIKLCDRVHNMYTLYALPMEKQKRIAEETLVVYAPIAHRLGISKLKNILEDKSFLYIFPQEYSKIDRYLSENRQSQRLKLNSFTSKVVEILTQNGFDEEDFLIQARVKHHYSVYSKMQKKGVSIDEILDLLAVRIITVTALDCYKILGLMHTHFRPLVARFKDYIALPKDNGYQTIHTTLFDKSFIFEAQIRTRAMHQTAELGVAAHWKYKSGGLEPKLEWLHGIQHNSENIEDFYELAKNDLFSEEIAIYSPGGDVYTLPLGATALDFAYAVHTHIGSHAKIAYINKEQRSLLTELQSGDMVRIETDNQEIIRCTWANAVKTSRARHHIKTECAHKIKEIDKKSAINILMLIFKASKREILQWLQDENMADLITKIPYKNNILGEIVARLKGRKRRTLYFTRYTIKKYHFHNMDVYSNYHIGEVGFDYCCHPKMGDEIVAFYKKGKAIIHHKMCENAHKDIDTGVPMLKAEWEVKGINTYKVVVTLENKQGALAHFVTFLAKEDVNINSIEIDNSNVDYKRYCEVEAEFPQKNFKKTKAKLEQQFKVIDFVSTVDAYNIK